MKKLKPWTDENGNPLSDTALKEASRGWSAETWNAYLDSLERHTHEENECSMSDLSIIDDLELKSLADLQPNTDHLSDEFLEAVKQSIEELPPLERFVMEEELYGGKSQRTIAQVLGCSRAWVQKIRKKAHSLLAEKLSGRRPS